MNGMEQFNLAEYLKNIFKKQVLLGNLEGFQANESGLLPVDFSEVRSIPREMRVKKQSEPSLQCS